MLTNLEESRRESAIGICMLGECHDPPLQPSQIMF